MLFGMIGELLESGLDVSVGCFDLGLFWCRALAGDRPREGREVDLERDECCVGNARLPLRFGASFVLWLRSARVKISKRTRMYCSACLPSVGTAPGPCG
jgi:hypothetical protein